MKTLLILAALLAATTAISYDDIFSQEWLLFKAQFRKTYGDVKEDIHRLKIYKRKRYEIALHNLKYLAGVASFQMGVNQFTDMHPKEVHKIYNGFKLRKFRDGDVMDDGEQFVRLPNMTVPDSVNWVDEGAVTPVRDQGQCGSCYAFASVGAMEGHHYLKAQELKKMSEQNIIDCTKVLGNLGCNGGDPAIVFSYVKKKGLDERSSYPYEGEEGQCRYKANTVVDKCNGFMVVDSGDEELLKAAVSLGPVTVAIDASLHSLQHYKSGVYNDPDCSSTNINHAVLVVGYGTDEVTKKDYWLVKNSWDKTWGEDGYIRIERNANNMCGIAARPIFPKL